MFSGVKSRKIRLVFLLFFFFYKVELNSASQGVCISYRYARLFRVLPKIKWPDSAKKVGTKARYGFGKCQSPNYLDVNRANLSRLSAEVQTIV